MQCLRQIIFLILSTKVFAAPGNITLSSSTMSNSGNPAVISQKDEKKSLLWRQEVKVNSSTFAKNWSLSANTNLTKLSDESLIVKDSKGFDQILSKEENQNSANCGC
jgi:hypothetical protein